MLQNFQTIRLPTAASQTTFSGGATWQNPSNILVDDASDSTIGLAGTGAASLFATGFDFDFPPGAVIDGVQVLIDSPFQVGGWLTVSIGLGLVGSSPKNALTVNGTYGGPNDLWGLTNIAPSTLSNIELDLFALGTVDDIIYVNYMQVGVYWHIDQKVDPTDVPTRIAYKVYSRDGNFLGELPNVTSKFAFSQDKNSAGSSINISCGQYAQNEVTVQALATEDDVIITTENDIDILATSTDIVLALGASDDEAIFKNSNRIVVFIYNYWHPNGKVMFAGQVNRVSFNYGGSGSISLTVLSDGIDLDNYIARGFPFSYTTDVTQSTDNGFFTVNANAFNGWTRYGQTWRTGGSVTNIGAIELRMLGSATVTIEIYDNVNGNKLASTSRTVSVSVATLLQFEFSHLVPVSSSTEYFFTISVGSGQSIRVYRNSANVYANGSAYIATFSGGSGGGIYTITSGDIRFITKSGIPTTTTTYTLDDPVSEMAAGIIADYNLRGGKITEREFVATGLSITNTFNSATIFDAINKVLELSPSGYYSYIDLGTSEIDIKPISQTADFTIVRGKDINELNMSLTIEQVKNYLLLSGGEITPGVNLFKEYQDSKSAAIYGTRLATKSDNRVSLDNTANAIGETFIEENASESKETTVSILDTLIDITLLTPGVTLGFKNFGNFIDSMVLQVVRRDYAPPISNLTLGRLPINMNSEIQRINRELLLEQTIDNPSSPN